MGHPKKGNHHLPTIHFFQLNVFVSGRVYTPPKKTEEIAPELAQMIGRRILSSQNGPFLKGYVAMLNFGGRFPCPSTELVDPDMYVLRGWAPVLLPSNVQLSSEPRPLVEEGLGRQGGVFQFW